MVDRGRTDAELFAPFGSACAPETVAVFTMEPPEPALTVIEKACEAPGASVPAVQVTIPAAWAQPAPAETNVEFAGTGSLTATPVAVVGPLFVATTV